MPPERQTLRLKIREREIQFVMNYDSDFIAYRNLHHYLSNNQLPEMEVLHVMERALRPGDVAVDAGANIGFFTMVMSQLVGDEGRVLAFEPDARNVTKLIENVGSNLATNTSVEPIALWSVPAMLRLYRGEDTGINSLRENSQTFENLPVQARRLVDVFPYYTSTGAINSLRLLKVDTEGAEQHVIEGSHPHAPSFIIAEMNAPALDKFNCCQFGLRTMLKDWGYDTFRLHEDGSIPTLIPENTTLQYTKNNFNVLFSTIEHVSEIWPVEVIYGQ